LPAETADPRGSTRARPADAPARPFDPDRLDARDPRLIGDVLPLARLLSRHYLRLRVEGLEHLARGPALYVSNHNGGLAGPDVASTLGTLWEALGPEAPLYALAHDFAMRHVPPFGALIQRFGAVRASRENATRILASNAQLLVYPGGDVDAYRHSSRRDHIVLGERTGFVRTAQETGAALVPIVVQGAHRSAYIFSEGEAIARHLRLKQWARLERFPLALALPWGLSLGPWLPYLPLPFPIQMRVLPPMWIAAAEDPAVARERVRITMQAALDELVERARRDASSWRVRRGP
jgi:1-acyl-sn-glycerol-3-phosphate acyltransferase